MTFSSSIGGRGGAGGNGADSDAVNNGGFLMTLGDDAMGVVAQSIGGGGGRWRSR